MIHKANAQPLYNAERPGFIPALRMYVQPSFSLKLLSYDLHFHLLMMFILVGGFILV